MNQRRLCLQHDHWYWDYTYLRCLERLFTQYWFIKTETLDTFPFCLTRIFEAVHCPKLITRDMDIMATWIKLMKGKALRKHSLHEKSAASVLLKLFISSNEWCHTTDTPYCMSGTPFSNVNNIHVHSMIPEDQKQITTQWCSTRRLFTAATQTLNNSCSKLNWWKEKPLVSIACTRKHQPRCYWSCSSIVMNDATPLTPPSAWAELHFQM